MHEHRLRPFRRNATHKWYPLKVSLLYATIDFRLLPARVSWFSTSLVLDFDQHSIRRVPYGYLIYFALYKTHQLIFEYITEPQLQHLLDILVGFAYDVSAIIQLLLDTHTVPDSLLLYVHNNIRTPYRPLAQNIRAFNRHPKVRLAVKSLKGKDKDNRIKV